MTDDLRLKEREILDTLRRHPGLTCTGLATRLPLYPHPLVTALTRGLHDRGLLHEVRVPSEAHGTVSRRYYLREAT